MRPCYWGSEMAPRSSIKVVHMGNVTIKPGSRCSTREQYRPSVLRDSSGNTTDMRGRIQSSWVAQSRPNSLMTSRSSALSSGTSGMSGTANNKAQSLGVSRYSLQSQAGAGFGLRPATAQKGSPDAASTTRRRFPLLGPTRQDAKLDFRHRIRASAAQQQPILLQHLHRPSTLDYKPENRSERKHREVSKSFHLNPIHNDEPSINSKSAKPGFNNILPYLPRVTTISNEPLVTQHNLRQPQNTSFRDIEASTCPSSDTSDDTVAHNLLMREKTIIPSRYGYHERSHSPTFHVLKKVRERLDASVQNQVRWVTAVFNKTTYTDPSMRFDAFYHKLLWMDSHPLLSSEDSYPRLLPKSYHKPSPDHTEGIETPVKPNILFNVEPSVYLPYIKEDKRLKPSNWTNINKRRISITLPSMPSCLPDEDDEEKSIDLHSQCVEMKAFKL